MTVVINGTSGITDVNGTAAAPAITGTDTDTGVFFGTNTVSLSTGGTERLQIDSSGNAGLGVTPSAWSGFTALQIQNGALFTDSTSFRSIMNGYYNGSNWIYSTTNAATRYEQVNGIHRWFNAASGTAGNAISFTQAMTLDASGRLGIGLTNPSYMLDVYKSSAGSWAHFSAPNTSEGSEMWLGTDTSDTPNICYLGINNTTGTSRLDFRFGGQSSAYTQMVMDSGGNFYVGYGSYPTVAAYFGTATNGATAQGGVSISGGGYGIVDVGHANGTASGSLYYRCIYNGSVIGSITQNGTTAVAYNTTSDYRLKENVQPLSGALARVAALKPCTYTWKSAPEEIGEGFIAHELAEVCPQAVTGEKDAVNEDGSIKPQSIDTSFLVATLTAAIQEQQAIITQLQADVAALKAKA